MHWITRLLKLLVKNQTGPALLKESKLVSELRDYARDKVKATFFDCAEPQDFSIERIVFTYLDYLIWKEKLNRTEKSKIRFTFRNSIEHFYPQNPIGGQDGGATVSKDNLNLLGNLALVSIGTNAKFSNHPPEVKAKYKSIVEQSPKLMMMADITRKVNQWGDKEVLEHHKEMVDLLKNDIGA